MFLLYFEWSWHAWNPMHQGLTTCQGNPIVPWLWSNAATSRCKENHELSGFFEYYLCWQYRRGGVSQCDCLNNGLWKPRTRHLTQQHDCGQGWGDTSGWREWRNRFNRRSNYVWCTRRWYNTPSFYSMQNHLTLIRLYCARIYRRSRSLERLQYKISHKVMGTWGFLSLRNHNLAQVLFPDK
jgi:hypothetical protein